MVEDAEMPIGGEGWEQSDDELSPRSMRTAGRQERTHATPLHGLHPKDEDAARAAALALSHITDRSFKCPKP
jgi:hypothetical protein